MTPGAFGNELSRERVASLRDDAGALPRSERPRRRRRPVRSALGLRLVSVGLHLIGDGR